jgi:hypothetical protein
MNVKSATATITPADALEYRQLIERLARGGVNQRITNGWPEHASILLESMFKHARSNVRIYSGSLRQDTYDQDELVGEAKRFLAKGGRLSILLQKVTADLADHKFVQAARSAAPGTLQIKAASGVYATDKAKHFAVMDDCGYRFEIDHAATKAVANFNEPAVACELISAFDRAFALAAPAAF